MFDTHTKKQHKQSDSRARSRNNRTYALICKLFVRTEGEMGWKDTLTKSFVFNPVYPDLAVWLVWFFCYLTD